jgi:histone H3/H4
VEFLRKLGIDRERQQAIPASAFDRIAREALKISAQHFAETAALRRHALLTAAALSLETGLTRCNAPEVRQADGRPVPQGRAA